MIKKLLILFSAIMIMGCSVFQAAKDDVKYTYDKTKEAVENTQKQIKDKYDQTVKEITETKEEVQKKDWNAYREYSPEKVMQTFKKVFIDAQIIIKKLYINGKF